jgi:tetratricopeptide (TPR) repeat protein
MSLELNLYFPDNNHVMVNFNGEDSGVLPFTNPLTAKDRRDIQWYLEIYGAHSLANPDDSEATRIEFQLHAWGKTLFEAVFRERAAARLFNQFQDSESVARLLTISAGHPAVLGLPWELLHDPASGGVFLFNETPRISIRRRVQGATGGRPTFRPEARERLHLLFIVSRPLSCGFIDPRADADAVLDALEQHAPDRFTWEFLRPATINALIERLEDATRPPVDILHFDGHGVFDRHGGIPEAVVKGKQSIRFPLEEDIFKEKATRPTTSSPPNTGYLLFEGRDAYPDFVSAQRFAENLHRHKIALIILSACQTAALGDNDEPMGSVAARLTAAGIPAVLAMTHSVLVQTTRALFGVFYKELVRGHGIGESLDNARRHLVNHPEKYEVQRGTKRVMLKLYDWFLPSLYQSGEDLPLLKKAEAEIQKSEFAHPRTNLPARPESGFYGRRRELWDIERWFAGKTRRITLVGFGGQGKTALALEAGRWLVRTGMFQAAVVLRYDQIPSIDALGVAVNNLGSVLGENIIDAKAAEEALKKTSTLVILDNLESLTPDSLSKLLDAAVSWSEAQGSCVLCTTRVPDFGHPDYPVEGSFVHRRIVVRGLGDSEMPDDALQWFGELMKLPPPPTVSIPSRNALIEIFDRVKFHPLSLRVLAGQLKTRAPKDLLLRLEELLSVPHTGSFTEERSDSGSEESLAELMASLQLSLEQLDEAARQVLPRLGVFQGGAMENNLLDVTEIDEQAWPALRRQLEAAALIEAEPLGGITAPFLRFHPTLSPMLWRQLGADERARLSSLHRRQYYLIATFLRQFDVKSPLQARDIALREAPNLLHAVKASLEAGDSEADEFADYMDHFLENLGLHQEAEALLAKALAAAGEAGSKAWVLVQSNRGDRFLELGRVADAMAVFSEVLEKLGDAPTYERAVALGRIGRCFSDGGRPDLAALSARDSIAIFQSLEQTHQVKRQLANSLNDLAISLKQQGEYAEARKMYNKSLKLAKELEYPRQQAVVLSQLGTLALQEGELREATQLGHAALEMWQQLGEPAAEAHAWHNLGAVFQQAAHWDEAERHYREAARIKEQQGNLAEAATTWSNIALVSWEAGKREAAEMWFRKAIEVDRKFGNPMELVPDLCNLASMLKGIPGRLAEARQLAEEALAVYLKLGTGAVEVWRVYIVLAEILEKEAEMTSDPSLKAECQTREREYRRLARDTEYNFAGTRHKLQQFAPHIRVVVDACAGKPEAQQSLVNFQQQLMQGGVEAQALSHAIDRVLDGELDETVLCEGLGQGAAMLVKSVLHALSDPSSLK